MSDCQPNLEEVRGHGPVLVRLKSAQDGMVPPQVGRDEPAQAGVELGRILHVGVAAEGQLDEQGAVLVEQEGDWASNASLGAYSSSRAVSRYCALPAYRAEADLIGLLWQTAAPRSTWSASCPSSRLKQRAVWRHIRGLQGVYVAPAVRPSTWHGLLAESDRQVRRSVPIMAGSPSTSSSTTRTKFEVVNARRRAALRLFVKRCLEV